MAINDEIAAGGRPIQFENPLNNMVKMFNIRNDMQTNQMNQMKMDEARRAQAGAEATRGFFRQPGLDIENMTPAQDRELAGLNYDVYEKLKTQQGKQRDERSQADKRSAETEALHILPYAAEYGRLNNRDEAVRLTTHMYANKNLANAPFRAKTLEQAIAAIPDDTTPEGKAAFKEYASKNALGAKDYADKQLLSFAVEGGNYVGRNKITGAIVSSSPISLTAEQNLYAPTDLEDKQARYKALAKQTADQDALRARTTAAGLPGTADMLAEQQRQRTAEQDALRGEIGVLQKQGQSAKHASAEFLQVSARLEQLRAAGKQDSPEGKALQARIAKETNIPQADESVVVRTTTDNDGTVHFYNRFGAELRSQPNAGKTAPDSLAGPEKRMPAHILETVAKNNAAVANIDNSIKQVQANPSSFGVQNYLPDAITQRTDPKGVTARATVANIGSLKIHDRSGAAVTVGETPRLRPFIPATNDDDVTVVKKLKELRREMLVMDQEYKKTLSEQGYRTSAPAGAAPAATRTGATVSNWN